MKVKLGQIYNSVGVLAKLLDTEIPVSLSYKLMKLINNLNTELKQVEEQRIKLVKKYSSSDKESVVSDESKDEFLKEFSVLLEEEVDIAWESVNLQNYGDSIKMSINDLTKVEYLFSE